MVSALHEVLISLFRESPTLALDLLRAQIPALADAGLRLHIGERNFTQLTEIDADLVIEVHGDDSGSPRCVLIKEVQLTKKEEKRFAWVAYQGTAHRRYRSPAYVVVVTIDPAVAEWARGPFDTGQTTFRPIVIGPKQIPAITDPDQARDNMELTVLSGLAHHDDPIVENIGEVLWASLDQNAPEYGDLYWDLFLRALGDATRRSLEMRLSNYEPQSDWGKRIFAEGEAKGRVEGEAKGRVAGTLAGEATALCVLLDARGIDVDDQLRTRVESCTDAATLHNWLRRAATATRLSEVFGEDEH